MTTAALPQAPQDNDEVIGVANLKVGGLATFEGDLAYAKLHPATLVNAVDVTGPDPFKKNEDGSPIIRPRICWLFTIDSCPEKGTVPFYTSTSLHEKSHFPKFVAALKRPLPAKNEPIRKAAFVGAKAVLLCEPQSKNNKTYPKVVKVMPVEA